MHFTISRPQEKKHSCEEAASAAARAIGACIGLRGQKRIFKKNSDLALVKIYRLSEFKIKYDFEDLV